MLPRAAIAIYESSWSGWGGQNCVQITYILVPKILLRHPLDILGCDGIYGDLSLLGCQPTSAGDELPSDVLRNRRGTIQTQEEPSLELALCPLYLDISGSQGHPGPFLQGEVYQVIEVHGVLRDEVDTPQSRVGV
jgi:hypothetical protein